MHCFEDPLLIIKLKMNDLVRIRDEAKNTIRTHSLKIDYFSVPLIITSVLLNDPFRQHIEYLHPTIGRAAECVLPHHRKILDWTFERGEFGEHGILGVVPPNDIVLVVVSEELFIPDPIKTGRLLLLVPESQCFFLECWLVRLEVVWLFYQCIICVFADDGAHLVVFFHQQMVLFQKTHFQPPQRNLHLLDLLRQTLPKILVKVEVVVKPPSRQINVPKVLLVEIVISLVCQMPSYLPAELVQIPLPSVESSRDLLFVRFEHLQLMHHSVTGFLVLCLILNPSRHQVLDTVFEN